MTLGGYNDRLRHEVRAIGWDLAGYVEVKVKLEGEKGGDEVSDRAVGIARGGEAEVKEEEDNEDVSGHSGEPMDIEVADSPATIPGEPIEDLENKEHKVSNLVDPWRNAIVGLDSLPMLGRQSGQEEITKSQPGFNCFAQPIGQGCVCFEFKAAGTGDGIMNPVQQGGQEMSLPYTPIACSRDVDDGDAMGSAKNETHTPPCMLIEVSSDDEDLDDLLPPVNTTRTHDVQTVEMVPTFREVEYRATTASFGNYSEKGGQDSNLTEPRGPNSKRSSSPAFEYIGKLEGSVVGSATLIPSKKKRKTTENLHGITKGPRNQAMEQLGEAQFSPPADVGGDITLPMFEMAELQHNYAMALEENHTLGQENATYKYQIKALQNQHFKVNREKDVMEDTNKDIAERNSELEEQIEDAESALVAEMEKRRVSEQALFAEVKKRENLEEALAMEIEERENLEEALAVEIDKRKKLEERVKKQEIEVADLEAKGGNRAGNQEEQTKEWKTVYATFLAQRSQK